MLVEPRTYQEQGFAVVDCAHHLFSTQIEAWDMHRRAKSCDKVL